MKKRGTAETVGLTDIVPADVIDAPPAEDKRSKAEQLFDAHLREAGVAFTTQHRFAKAVKRQWRFDFAMEKFKLAVEIDGVVVRFVNGARITTGRHADVAGMRADMFKGNTAVLWGWSVLHFLQTDVKPRHAIKATLRVLAQRGWRP